jgi:hypothetical protein
MNDTTKKNEFCEITGSPTNFSNVKFQAGPPDPAYIVTASADSAYLEQKEFQKQLLEKLDTVIYVLGLIGIK